MLLSNAVSGSSRKLTDFGTPIIARSIVLWSGPFLRIADAAVSSIILVSSWPSMTSRSLSRTHCSSENDH